MNFQCPKEVAGILGVSERSARRMMASQEIESFRIGERGWRTTTSRIAAYADRQFDRYRRAPTKLVVMPQPGERSAA